MNNELENKKVNDSKAKKLDRIVLDTDSVAAINKIMNQVESELSGLIQPNPKLIANFILKKRSAFLTSEELNELRAENYDVIKAFKKATVEAIKAKQSGVEIDFNELLKIIQTPGVNSVSTLPIRRGRKKKIKTPPDDQFEFNHSIDGKAAVKAAFNDPSELEFKDSKITKNRTLAKPDSP